MHDYRYTRQAYKISFKKSSDNSTCIVLDHHILCGKSTDCWYSYLLWCQRSVFMLLYIVVVWLSVRVWSSLYVMSYASHDEYMILPHSVWLGWDKISKCNIWDDRMCEIVFVYVLWCMVWPVTVCERANLDEVTSGFYVPIMYENREVHFSVLRWQDGTYWKILRTTSQDVEYK